MPRPAKNVDDWRPHIELRLQTGYTQEEIRGWLLQQGMDISPRTLRRRLQAWGIHTKITVKPEEAENLREAIHRLMWSKSALTDKKMAKILRIDGFTVGRRAVQRIRLELGDMKRTPKDELPGHNELIANILKAEYDDGRIQEYGTTYLGQFMRNTYHIIGRNRITSIAREVYEQGFASRQPTKKKRVRSGRLMANGADHVYSIDAFCKLEAYGIGIYAAIDVFSRMIIWFYIGPLHRTKWSVGAQYIANAVCTGCIPHIIRSDKGVETTVLADCHLALREYLEGRELDFTEAFWYTSSKGNNTIEQWWAQQSKSTLNRWRDWFGEMREQHLFSYSRLADRIAFLAIYMPIISRAVGDFVQIWNNHTIRKSAHPEVVTGIPSILHGFPKLIDRKRFAHAIDANDPALESWKQLVDDFDFDSYLPPETREWCEATLVAGGFPARLHGGENVTNRANGEGEDDSEDDAEDDAEVSKLHPIAYEYLRDSIAEHLKSQQEPELSEFERPTRENYRPRQRTVNVFRDAGEALD